MPQIHPATISPDDLLAQCNVRRLRRGGPGGQHRNKVETAVVLEHRPTGIRAEANERRSQAENQQRALFRLRIALALEVRTLAGNQPSDLWQSRQQGMKLSVNPEHDDFPALLSEVFNVLDTCEYDATPTAEMLGISNSQLVKLIKLEPAAFQRLNKMRTERGLHALK